MEPQHAEPFPAQGLNFEPSFDMDDASGASLFDLELAVEQMLADATLQHIVLRNESEGVQYVSSYQRIEFQPEQQTAVVHLPFAPPLDFVPAIEGYFMDGTNARIRVTESQRFGARVEVVLDEVSDESLSRVLVLNVSACPNT